MNDITNNIINIKDYKERKVKKKESDDEFGRGRQPLYVSHLTGKVSGSVGVKPDDANMGERLQRIRASLNKINGLMADLKRMHGDPFK